MGSTCPANEKGIKRKVVVYMLGIGREKENRFAIVCDDAIDGASCCSRDLRCEEQKMGKEDNATVSARER